MNAIAKMQVSKELKNIVIIVISYLSILGCVSKFDIYNNKIIFNGNNFLYIIILFGLYYVLRNTLKIKDKRINVFSIIFSVIISSVYITSYLTSNYFLNNSMPHSKCFILFVLLKYFSIVLLSYIVIKQIYLKFDSINENEENKKIRFFSDNKLSILLITLVLFIAYSPYLIDSFPGNLTYDFAIQIRQALEYEPVVNHHPYLTTKFIALCLKVGNLINNHTIGVFIYTCVQYLFTCFTFSFSIYYMAKRKISLKFRLLALLFYIAIPIFGFYAVWLTKDIIFSIAVSLITIGMIDFYYNKDCLKSKKYIIAMIICLLISMIFRKNGVYVSIILLLSSLISDRKNWLKIIILFGIPIIVFKIIDGPIRNNMGIQDGSSTEMYSIPAQQMARIYTYEKDNLSDDLKQRIEEYINDDNIEQLYDPLLSDPVKAKMNEEKINYSKIDFFKLCIELAIKYPNRTFESFTCTTYRFYYLNNEIARGLGKYKEQSNYVIHNLLPENTNIDGNNNSIGLTEKMDEVVYENSIPVLSTLCGCGIYINIYIICIGYLIYRKKYKLLISFLPVMTVLLTQIAGPVVDQRYMYSAFTCFPILMGATIYFSKNNNNK